MEPRCHRGPERVSLGGVHGVERRYPEVPVFKQLCSRSEIARRCQSCGPCTPQAAPRWITGQWASGMSWSTVVVSRRLHDGTVPRAQGQLCGQHVVPASGIPSVAGPRLSLLRRASWDERRWGRQDGGKADSGCDGPVGGTTVLCREPEPLMPWL